MENDGKLKLPFRFNPSSMFNVIFGVLYLVGGIPTPLKNMKVSWEYSHIYGKIKMFQTTNQCTSVFTSKCLLGQQALMPCPPRHSMLRPPTGVATIGTGSAVKKLVLIRGARPEVRPRKPEGSCFALLEWIAINPRDMFGFNRVPGFLHKTLYIYMHILYI